VQRADAGFGHRTTIRLPRRGRDGLVASGP
jgi:hypothetical protein